MSGIFDSLLGSAVSVGPFEFLACIGAALAAGFMLSGIYMYRNRHSESFALTVAVLPAIVSVVIMAVSGDIGAGIAVAGAFSLVRFRSAPGSAKEIAVIFLSMAVGLLMGMGFVAYALMLAAIVGAAMLLCSRFGFGGSANNPADRVLKVTVPEGMDYEAEMEPVLDEHTVRHELSSVRSVNMGSMFKLTYNVTLKDPSKQRSLMDAVRVRNGNLEVAVLREDAENRGGL
jgi:uncharacterized membrane protein YhiD involved in acid resistance